MNSAWGKHWRRVNEVIWLYLWLSGTAWVLGCCAGSAVSGDILAKLVGMTFLSWCFCGVCLSLKLLAQGHSEPVCSALKGKGLTKSTQEIFFPYSGRGVSFPSPLNLWENKQKQSQHTHTCTKPHSVHEAGAVGDEGLSPNPSILSFYPVRPCNALLGASLCSLQSPVCPACPCMPCSDCPWERARQPWPRLREVHSTFPPAQWQNV